MGTYRGRVVGGNGESKCSLHLGGFVVLCEEKRCGDMASGTADERRTLRGWLRKRGKTRPKGCQPLLGAKQQMLLRMLRGKRNVGIIMMLKEALGFLADCH